jgi:hypothetical protein
MRSNFDMTAPPKLIERSCKANCGEQKSIIELPAMPPALTLTNRREGCQNTTGICGHVRSRSVEDLPRFGLDHYQGRHGFFCTLAFAAANAVRRPLMLAEVHDGGG